MATQNKTALITGGTSGIGLELAKLFAADNYNLVLVARNEEELQKTSMELMLRHNIQAHTIAKDLIRRESPFEIYDEIKVRGVRIDVLVNNAGMGHYGKFAERDINRDLEIIQLNIGASVILTKLFVRDMIGYGEGKVLNVGSIAGEAPGPWQAVYHGTKAFVNSWSTALGDELKDTGVTITLLVPGATATDFFRKANMERSKIVQSELSDPAKVAMDGYKALMAGDYKIVSGFKNKAQVAMAHVVTDKKAAETMDQQQKPVEGDQEA